MNDPVSYLNGSFHTGSKLALSVDDLGVLQGVAVSERMRTFRGRLFRLDEHLVRLAQSLQIIDVPLDCSQDELAQVADQLVDRNQPLLQDGDDLGLSLFVTPGVAGTGRPTLGIECYPLPFGQWASYYSAGQALTETPVRQVPDSCWPTALKCRSRMHYYLADLAARRQDPGSRAVLLDQEGFVTEASTANLVIYQQDRGIISPPLHRILPGVSLGVLHELASALEIPMLYQDLRMADLAHADEILLCSTSPCVWPATRLNGQRMRRGTAGPIFHRLLDAWSELVGLDIAAQAQQFAWRMD